MAIDETTIFLQEEIRQLHAKLRQKDLIVQEFKREAQEYQTQKAGEMTERSSKLVALLEKDSFTEACTK